MIRKTISMPDNMGEWIAGRITQGQYNNESEYFRDLVRRDQQDQQQLKYLMRRLDAGEAELAAGEYTTLSTDADIDGVFDELEAES